jgi:hypothetical protein
MTEEIKSWKRIKILINSDSLELCKIRFCVKDWKLQETLLSQETIFPNCVPLFLITYTYDAKQSYYITSKISHVMKKSDVFFRFTFLTGAGVYFQIVQIL